MRSVPTLLLISAAVAFSAGRPEEIPFQKHTIDLGANEACAVADINGDGRLDIVSGENWFEAPKWTRHKFRELLYTNQYVDDFSDLPLDVNGDGHIDVITATWFARKLSWWQNPGRGRGEWKEHIIESGHNSEFAFLVDIDNDGRSRELLPQFGNPKSPLAWYELKNGSSGVWEKHVIAPRSYPHGIGLGDVNGDGRNDILTPKGWFEAPADPRDGNWEMHAEYELDSVGFMYVYDVNQDGRRDIVTSAAHNYGVFWLERGEGGTWTKQMIDDSWSQAHALTLLDVNGDGRKDLLTGKRYMAHNGRDPGEREPLGIYWYESLKPEPGKKLEWVKHVVDYGSRTGGGMQIPVVDIDGDGDLDFVVAGKSGVFLFENLTRKRAN